MHFFLGALRINKYVACWVILHGFSVSADIFQNYHFRKVLSDIPSECQTVWVQIRPDKMLDLIWVQIVCKGDQQMRNSDHFSGCDLLHNNKQFIGVKGFSQRFILYIVSWG